MLFCIGTDHAWADNYVFDQNAKATFVEGTSTFTFDSKTIEITNDGSKKSGKVTTEFFLGLKYSAGVTYTVTFPEDEIVKSISFTGHTRGTTGTTYVDYINGVQRNDGNNEPGSTQFPNETTSDDDENVTDPTGTYKVNFYSTKQNTVSFKLKGHESNLVITVETEKVGQKYTVNFSVPDVYGANVPDGTLRARNVTTGQDLTSGGQVNSGDVVEFTAWDFCGNAAQGAVGAGRLTLDGWRINGGNVIKDNIPMSGISWWHADIKYQLTVESDIDFEAVYALNYFLHFKDNLGSTDKTYQYDGGTAYAYVDAEKLASNASAFRGNSTVIATATPASGYAFDHWEGQLKGAGDDPVWENSEWSKDNPFTFTSSGSTFDYAWGNDIFVKPVFKSLGVVVGPNAMDKGWNGNTADAYSSDVTLGQMQECTYEFDVRNGGKTDPWNSWVIAASANENVYDAGNAYFTLRPDNYVFNGWTGTSNQTLSLVGGALDWETFKRDLDGAHVTAKVSFDGKDMFVYQVIENNGRTYTTYYPYTLGEEKEQVYLRLGVDQSQLTNYSAVVKRAFKVYTEPRSNLNVKDTSRGKIIMTNEQGTQVLEGSVVGKDTKIFVTAIANEGYAFIGWNGKDLANPREFITGYEKGVISEGETPETTTSYTFYGQFKALTDFATTWKLGDVPSQEGRLQAKNGNNFVDWTDTDNKGVVNGQHSPSNDIFSGIYKGGEELAATKGLLFNNQVAKMNSISDAIQLDADNKGKLRVPVTEGEIVTITWRSAKNTRSLYVVNVDGTGEWTAATAATYTTSTVIANGTGYIELQDNTDNNLYIKEISKTAVRDFSFADGSSIPAQPGCDDYINPVVGTGIMKPIVENASFSWTSSNPAEVQVDANTGRIVVNESFSGSVQITATMNAVINGETILLPAISKSYTLTTSTNKMYFKDAKVSKELNENGVVIYWQNVKWTDDSNIPSGTIKYSIMSSSVKANITDGENDGDEKELTVVGAGATVIKATCGALSATYTLTTFGLVFPETAAIYDFTGSYTQAVPNASGLTYTIEQKHGAIEDVNLSIDSNGKITGFPAYADNKGGAIVVSAADAEGKSVKYVLTIPYKKYTWDFYNEGKSAPKTEAQYLNAENHFTYGDLVGSANPGAASEVPSIADIPNTGSEFPKKYVIDGFGQNDAIKKLLNWQNKQGEDDVKNNPADPHNYWNYTFKTLRHVDKTYKKPIDYVNEPLFSYKGAVNGNNVRIINETQGLIFDCATNAFGVNDNKNGSTVDVREQDRAILLYKDNSFTIPFVLKDHYVKIHWYRHSTDAGDMFSVTNAKDLDGVTINPADKLRFTGSHYESKSEYRGYTILQALSDGPMTITNTAPASWIELYTVEVTDEYATELKVEYATVIGGNNDGWGGPCSSYYNNNGMFDMHDNLVSVVRKTGSAGNKAYTEADIAVTSYPSLEEKNKKDSTGKPIGIKVDNCAALTSQPVGENPIIYIGSFPGYTNGWNGWSLDVEAFPVDEDARNLKIGLQKELVTRVGNRISYGVHALTNFEGTGTAHVIVRTKSGGVDGSPRYTLDQQEAYFAVGEYHAQEYPYTWDFTTYNMENESVSAEDLTYATTHASVKESYGGWKSTNDWRKLYTIANNEDQNPQTRGVAATVPYSLPNSNARRYNKFLFADGSQLPINAGHGAFEMRESDGLRVSIGAKMKTYMDRAITLYTDDRGLELNSEEAAITIPEVDKGMYIFVRVPEGADAPTSKLVYKELNATTGAYDTKEVVLTQTRTNKEHVSFFADNADVEMNTGDIPSNVYVYKQDKEGKNDVVIYPNSKIEAIGVTNYFKPMVYFGNTARSKFATDSREERIDYSNTKLFTNHQLIANIAKNPTTTYKEGDEEMYKENGNVGLYPVTVVPSVEEAPGVNRGLVVETNPVEGCTTTTTRPLLPLFVPACNIQNGSIDGNLLVERINGGEDEQYPASTKNGTFNYILTNQYYDWHWAEGTWNTDPDKNGNAVDHSHNVAEAVAFYILRESSAARKNSAYLSIPCPSGPSSVKQFYMLLDGNDEESVTAIENISIPTGTEESVEPIDIYTITGVKVNGMPTKKGIYVVNGKKVFVK